MINKDSEKPADQQDKTLNEQGERENLERMLATPPRPRKKPPKNKVDRDK